MYAADFEADTADLTIEEVGAYIRLLNFQWLRGSIPADPQRRKSILRVSAQKNRKIWSTLEIYFYEENGAFFNKRLSRERAKAIELSEKRAAIGKKGALAKAKAIGLAKGVAKICPPQSQSHKRIKQDAAASVDNSKKQDDPKAEIWNLWVRTCGQAGVTEGAARSFLGKQLKAHPERAVFAAVGVTCSESRADPRAFLAGQLKAHPKTGRRADSETAMSIPDAQFMAWAAGLGFTDDKFPRGYDLVQSRQWLARTLKNRERAGA